jgi:hypothetical protein
MRREGTKEKESVSQKLAKAKEDMETGGEEPKEPVGELAEIARAYHLSGEQMAADTPLTIDEARASDEKDEWEEAMKNELSQLKEMGTYELVDLPKERKAVGCKWVFVKKTDANGAILKHKARLVAQGFSQIPVLHLKARRTISGRIRIYPLQ